MIKDGEIRKKSMMTSIEGLELKFDTNLKKTHKLLVNQQ